MSGSVDNFNNLLRDKRKRERSPSAEGNKAKSMRVREDYPAAGTNDHLRDLLDELRSAMKKFTGKPRIFTPSDDQSEQLEAAVTVYAAVANVIVRTRRATDTDNMTYNKTTFAALEFAKASDPIRFIDDWVLDYKLRRAELQDAGMDSDDVDKAAEAHLRKEASTLGLSSTDITYAISFIHDKNSLYLEFKKGVDLLDEHNILTTSTYEGGTLPDGEDELIQHLKVVLEDYARSDTLNELGKAGKYAGPGNKKEKRIKFNFHFNHTERLHTLPTTYKLTLVKRCNRILQKVKDMDSGDGTQRADAALQAAKAHLRKRFDVLRLTEENVEHAISEISNKFPGK